VEGERGKRGKKEKRERRQNGSRLYCLTFTTFLRAGAKKVRGGRERKK